MLMIFQHKQIPSIIDRQSLHALGVLIPIQFHPVKVLPGRHPLGRAGDGMRLLRTRPYVAGEDNPKDIDKFSPANERRVVEWEDEAQASITLLADTSASMSASTKAALRNACLLQLTYSLWRAGDRVDTTFFDSSLRQQIRAANLKIQMERLAAALARQHATEMTDISSVLRLYLDRFRHHRSDLLFVLSDFVTTGTGKSDPETTWRPLLKQMRRNIVPVVISFEISRRSRGAIKLWDAERQSRRQTWLSSQRIQRINQEEKERVASLVSYFKSAGLDHMILSNQRQIYPQLAKLARMRRIRKH